LAGGITRYSVTSPGRRDIPEVPAGTLRRRRPGAGVPGPVRPAGDDIPRRGCPIGRP